MDQGFNSNQSSAAQEYGYLVVRVSTALGAIPLKDATVNIRANTDTSSGVLYSMLSDADGLTKKVSLPAPPRVLSESPQSTVPFSTWNVDVFKEGYIPASFQGVPVYSSIVSVQPAVLVPIGDRFTARNNYSESTEPDLLGGTE